MPDLTQNTYKSKYSGKVIDDAISKWLTNTEIYLTTDNLLSVSSTATILVPVLDDSKKLDYTFLPFASKTDYGIVKVGKGLDVDKSGVISISADIQKLSDRIDGKVGKEELYQYYVRFDPVSAGSNICKMIINNHNHN